MKRLWLVFIIVGLVVTTNAQIFRTYRYRDMGVIAILIPDTLYGGQIVNIRVSIGNFGACNEVSVPVTFYFCNTGYTNTQMVSLNAGSTTILTFANVYLPPGIYYFKCVVWLDDDNPANNVREKIVVVLRTNIEELPPSGKNQEKKSTITRISDFKSQFESKKLTIFEPTGRPTNLNTLKSGVYFLRVPNKDKLTTRKVMLIKE